ncbi:hypothetical protein J6590_077217 [Homalodisca vitripennis]|nr:hypothetical protein J6590_077217 [Homalodisca vitripennis]
MNILLEIWMILSLHIVIKVDTLNVCKPEIIKKIFEINGHPKCILNTNSELGHLTFYSVPKADRTPGIKCVKGYVDPPCNKSADAHTIYYFDDTSIAPLQQDWKQYDEGNGYVKELDSSNNVFHLYYLNVDKVYCYYRCAANTAGSDFAAVAVTIGTQHDPDVLKAVAECKKRLKAVGLCVDLEDIETCTEY